LFGPVYGPGLRSKLFVFMPKSAKKRKDKAADFSKARLKLGKGKQLASNAIDTSFKARCVSSPLLSITFTESMVQPLLFRPRASPQTRMTALLPQKDV
jgi:hypothetical protein